MIDGKDVLEINEYLWAFLVPTAYDTVSYARLM